MKNKIKITVDDIYQVINTRANEKIERLYNQRAPWLANFDFEACEMAGHDPAMVFEGIVDCDEEWRSFMDAASDYIKNKEYGYTMLIKDLRNSIYSVSRTGNVKPKI